MFAPHLQMHQNKLFLWQFCLSYSDETRWSSDLGVKLQMQKPVCLLLVKGVSLSRKFERLSLWLYASLKYSNTFYVKFQSFCFRISCLIHCYLPFLCNRFRFTNNFWMKVVSTPFLYCTVLNKQYSVLSLFTFLLKRSPWHISLDSSSNTPCKYVLCRRFEFVNECFSWRFKLLHVFQSSACWFR